MPEAPQRTVAFTRERFPHLNQFHSRVLGLKTSRVLAEDTTCQGTLEGIKVDNVIVPDGQTCTLNGTQVDGNVNVGSNATLQASDAKVDGNIQAKNAAAVDVKSGSVGGNIQVKQGKKATISGVQIDSDLQFESNSGELVADSNRIGGNLQASQNTGSLSITKNNIDGNLQCQNNKPAPTGSGNTAKEGKEDQCSAL